MAWTSLKDFLNDSKSSPGSPAIKSKCCITFFPAATFNTFSFIFSYVIYLFILCRTSLFVVWTPTSNWNLPFGALFNISICSSVKRSAATSKWNLVSVSCSLKYLRSSTVYSLLQLKVLSTNLTNFNPLSMKYFNSFFTLSTSKNLTPCITDERQYLHLKGHPLEAS